MENQSKSGITPLVLMTQRFEHFPVILIILAAFYPTSENGFCINQFAFANKNTKSSMIKAPCSKGRGLGMLFCCSDYSEISENEPSGIISSISGAVINSLFHVTSPLSEIKCLRKEMFWREICCADCLPSPQPAVDGSSPRGFLCSVGI